MKGGTKGCPLRRPLPPRPRHGTPSGWRIMRSFCHCACPAPAQCGQLGGWMCHQMRGEPSSSAPPRRPPRRCSRSPLPARAVPPSSSRLVSHVGKGVYEAAWWARALRLRLGDARGQPAGSPGSPAGAGRRGGGARGRGARLPAGPCHCPIPSRSLAWVQVGTRRVFWGLQSAVDRNALLARPAASSARRGGLGGARGRGARLPAGPCHCPIPSRSLEIGRAHV